MSAGNKATWAANAKASGLEIAGYHYFLREAQLNSYLHAGLMAYWPCNRIVENNILDLSGNDNTGILDVDPPSDAPVLAAGLGTKLKSSLYYDGNQKAIRCGRDSTLLQPPRLTIEFFFKLPTSKDGVSVGIMNKRVGGDAWYVNTSNDNEVNFRLWGLTENSVKAVTPCIVETPYMVNFTYDGSHIRVYLNGYEDNNIAATGTPAQQPTSDLYIGASYYIVTGPYTGWIGDVCLYNRVISPAEIATRYKFATRKI